MGDFVLFKEDVERIQKILSHLLTESAATYVLLINKDGNLIAHVGFNSSIDATSLAALAAGSFASTRAIAALIGETEFSVMFHQGAKENVHISLVDEDGILVLIFDDRTNLGMVKMVADQARRKLVEVLNDVRANDINDQPPAEGGGADLSDRIDLLFPGNG
jgi:predicted regulator of Ras-like GTPase activity (Roadblock/LC7/MglB family)